LVVIGSRLARERSRLRRRNNPHALLSYIKVEPETLLFFGGPAAVPERGG
jgi:hypothetical protein